MNVYFNPISPAAAFSNRAKLGNNNNISYKNSSLMADTVSFSGNNKKTKRVAAGATGLLMALALATPVKAAPVNDMTAASIENVAAASTKEEKAILKEQIKEYRKYFATVNTEIMALQVKRLDTLEETGDINDILEINYRLGDLLEARNTIQGYLDKLEQPNAKPSMESPEFSIRPMTSKEYEAYLDEMDAEALENIPGYASAESGNVCKNAVVDFYLRYLVTTNTEINEIDAKYPQDTTMPLDVSYRKALLETVQGSVANSLKNALSAKSNVLITGPSDFPKVPIMSEKEYQEYLKSAEDAPEDDDLGEHINYLNSYISSINKEIKKFEAQKEKADPERTLEINYRLSDLYSAKNTLVKSLLDALTGKTDTDLYLEPEFPNIPTASDKYYEADEMPRLAPDVLYM